VTSFQVKYEKLPTSVYSPYPAPVVYVFRGTGVNSQDLIPKVMAPPLTNRRLAHWLLLSGICTLALLHYNRFLHAQQEVPIHVAKALDRCRSLTTVPGPPSDFYSRSTSDRFEPGTKPTVIISISRVGHMY